MNDTKLCINCRSCTIDSPEKRAGAPAFCKKGEKSLVDGSEIALCRVVRDDEAQCGVAAAWFEPRSRSAAPAP